MNAPLSYEHEQSFSLIAIPNITTSEQLTKSFRYILQLLLDGRVVQALADRELSVHALLRDIEILHVKETVLSDGFDECLCELLATLWRVIQAEVNCDEVRPVEVFLVAIFRMGRSAGPR